MLLLQVIVGGLLLGAIYALFSSGLTLIWGMMNFINFAHGEFVMLGMYVSLLVVSSSPPSQSAKGHCFDTPSLSLETSAAVRPVTRRHIGSRSSNEIGESRVWQELAKWAPCPRPLAEPKPESVEANPL